jgi:SAM-dependent methyltransferase
MPEILRINVKGEFKQHVDPYTANEVKFYPHLIPALFDRCKTDNNLDMIVASLPAKDLDVLIIGAEYGQMLAELSKKHYQVHKKGIKSAVLLDRSGHMLDRAQEYLEGDHGLMPDEYFQAPFNKKNGRSRTEPASADAPSWTLPRTWSDDSCDFISICMRLGSTNEKEQFRLIREIVQQPLKETDKWQCTQLTNDNYDNRVKAMPSRFDFISVTGMIGHPNISISPNFPVMLFSLLREYGVGQMTWMDPRDHVLSGLLNLPPLSEIRKDEIEWKSKHYSRDAANLSPAATEMLDIDGLVYVLPFSWAIEPVNGFETFRTKQLEERGVAECNRSRFDGGSTHLILLSIFDTSTKDYDPCVEPYLAYLRHWGLDEDDHDYGVLDTNDTIHLPNTFYSKVSEVKQAYISEINNWISSRAQQPAPPAIMAQVGRACIPHWRKQTANLTVAHPDDMELTPDPHSWKPFVTAKEMPKYNSFRPGAPLPIQYERTYFVVCLDKKHKVPVQLKYHPTMQKKIQEMKKANPGSGTPVRKSGGGTPIRFAPGYQSPGHRQTSDRQSSEARSSARREPGADRRSQSPTLHRTTSEAMGRRS